VILPKANASLSTPTKKSAKQYQPQTFQAWRNFFAELKKEPLHENLTKFFFWAIKAQIPEDDFVHIKVALEDSPRMKKEPERWLELQNGEWENLFNWCKQQAGQSAKEEKPEETAMPLPPGYVLRKSGLFLETVDSKGKPSRQLIYAGFFRVVGFYADADTGFSYIEIQMETNEEIKNVIVPQDQVSTRSAIVKTLAKLGGRITEENAKACVKFITASMNPGYIEKLQHTKYTRRLGFHGNSFVLPGRTLGEKSNLEYKGVLNDVRIEDQEIYTNTVRTIFNEWGEDAWVAGAALGFSLASPFVGHLRLNRNPILVLTGESGSGKSTLLNFAISALTPKLIRPFLIQGSVPNTPISFSQNIAGLNGMPCFFDEINLAEAQRGRVIRWGDAAISFANGQTRMRGSKDNEFEAQGGESFFGILLGAGESLPKSNVEGVYNRQIEINVSQHPPFGVGPSQQGQNRAHLLERAMEQGAGVLGGDFVQFVLDNWEAFQSHYSVLRAEWGWRFKSHTQGLALIVTVLRFLGRLLKVDTETAINTMLEKMEYLYCDFEHQENHPANRAREVIRDMISLSEQAKNRDGTLLDYYLYNKVPFCWKTEDGDYAIPATCSILENAVDDVAQYYKKWVDSGFMLPGTKKSTQTLKSKISGSVARCIVISRAFIESPDPENQGVTGVTAEEKDSQKQDVTLVTPPQKQDENGEGSSVTGVTVEEKEAQKPEVTLVTPPQKKVGSVAAKPKRAVLHLPKAQQPGAEPEIDTQNGVITPVTPVEKNIIELRKIFENMKLKELPDVLRAVERLPMPDYIWERITEYLANCEKGLIDYKKRDFLSSIAGWVNEEMVSV
jgi:energy-coupling factor transporter ATP-binding protein EcfA2